MESTVKITEPAGEEADILQTESVSRKWMSVKEMGDLLGLRKTDRYWLVHKNVFETETMYGKMWVNIPSFEKWYANQAKYRKITGEEPGLELKKWSLSPRDISELLEIPEYRVYDLIKEKHWETVTVDYWISACQSGDGGTSNVAGEKPEVTISDFQPYRSRQKSAGPPGKLHYRFNDKPLRSSYNEGIQA